MKRVGGRLGGRAASVVVTVVVSLSAVMVGVSIWRYAVSRNADKNALNQRQIEIHSLGARNAITDEGGIVATYATHPSSSGLADLAARRAELSSHLQALLATPGTDSGDHQAVQAIQKGQTNLDNLFTSTVQPVAGTPQAIGPTKVFDAAITQLEETLDKEIANQETQSAQAVAKADSNASTATAVAIAAAVLAVLAVLVALFAGRLLNRLFRQADEQF
ncbi:MAG TPA: hypothetical protein VGY32_14985, partial [Solirubrobacteraceae bacterium]|nr:hypothetical protein [Solirubrobacteraceae bacterium]